MKAVEEFAKEAKEARDKLDVSKLIANTLIAGKDSNNTKIERAVKTVNKMEQALSDTKAEAIGMGDAYATMVAKIQNGSFGNYEGLFGQDLKNLQIIHQTLLDMAANQAFAGAQKDGISSYINDFCQAQRKNQNDKIQNEIDAEKLRNGGRDLTQADIAEIKRKNDYYFGLGDDVHGQFKEYAESINKQATLTKQLGEILRTDAFGDATIQSIQNAAGELDTVNDKLKETASILGGFTFDNLSNIAKGLSAGLTGLAAGFGDLGADIGAEITDNVTPALTNLPKDVETRMAQAMQRLMGNGLSQIEAAGIVGNLVAESNLDPTRSGDNGTSIGIAQWHKERMVAMKSWITMQGRDWRDMNAQLDFLVYELRTSEKIAGEQLKLARNPAEAAKIFMNLFERPAEWAKRQSQGKRVAAAQRANSIASNSGAAEPIDVPINLKVNEKFVKEAEKAGEVVKNALADDWAKTAADELTNRTNAFKNLAQGDLQKFQRDIADIINMRADMGEKEKALIQAARKMGIDLNNEEVAAIMEQIREIEKKYDLMKQVGAIAESTHKNEAQHAAKLAELRNQIANPDYKGASAELQKINQQIDEILPKIEMAFGGTNAQEYQWAKGVLEGARDRQLELELAQFQAHQAKEVQVFRQAFMTKAQIREANLQRDLARIDEWLAYRLSIYADDVEAVRVAEEAKELIRQKAAQQANPVLNQMHEWQDIQGNLEKAATGWMESLADGIAGLITGTGDLRGAIQGIINDIAKMATKWLLSGLFGGTGEGGTSAIKQLFKKTATAGTMHTGGIAGNGSMLRSMSAITWAGAPKFHSGGFVGGLLPSEVPIIAKKRRRRFYARTNESYGRLPTKSNGADQFTDYRQWLCWFPRTK